MRLAASRQRSPSMGSRAGSRSVWTRSWRPSSSDGRLYLFILYHDRADARAFFDAFAATIDLPPETAAAPGDATAWARPALRCCRDAPGAATCVWRSSSSAVARYPLRQPRRNQLRLATGNDRSRRNGQLRSACPVRRPRRSRPRRSLRSPTTRSQPTSRRSSSRSWTAWPAKPGCRQRSCRPTARGAGRPARLTAIET